MVNAAEMSLLGACLFAAYALPAAVDEGVVEPDFASPTHQAIWRTMLVVQSTLSASEKLDPVLVATHMNGELDVVGGAAYLQGLVTSCPVYMNARQYAREVIDGSLERKLHGRLLDWQDRRLGGAALLELIQQETFALERRPREATTMSDAFQEVWAEVEHPTKATCSYPWREVDYCTRGLRPGSLHYLAAETSFGKTAGAVAIAEDALDHGKTVLFVSLELTAFELAVRFAQRSGFRAEVLYGRSATDADFSALLALIGQDKWNRLRVERVENVTQIGSVIRRTKPDLVILDYIGLLDIGRESRVEGTTRNSHALKTLARQYEVPVLALSQLSRAAREDRGKLPVLSRLRDSGALENDADAVVFIHRRRGEDGESLLPEGSFIVAKARMGVTGKVDFAFDGEWQTFTLLTRDERL